MELRAHIERAQSDLSAAEARTDEAETFSVAASLGSMLTTANQYLGHRGEALRQFGDAHSLATSARARRLEHFVLHHWGRFLAEAGEIDRARECFTRALELRVELGDPKQASSRRALEALTGLANESGT